VMHAPASGMHRGYEHCVGTIPLSRQSRQPAHSASQPPPAGLTLSSSMSLPAKPSNRSAEITTVTSLPFTSGQVTLMCTLHAGGGTRHCYCEELGSSVQGRCVQRDWCNQHAVLLQ
jgi:hypothetical protein